MGITFDELEYIRPDMDQVISAVRKDTRRIREAASFSEFQSAFEDFHQVMENYRSMCQIVEIRFTQDVRDSFYAQENEALGEMMPAIEEETHKLYQELLACPYSEELDKAYGPMLLRKLRYQAVGSGEAVTELKKEENRLLAQFQAINGTSQIPFMGKIIPVEQLYPYKGDKNREVRRAAYCAEGEYYRQYKSELEDIYDKLVKNRNAQAKALGFDNYAELSLIFMNRMGYDLDDIAYYRNQVVKYWVPAVSEIKEMQRQRLGLSDWKAYDNLLYFPDYNPTPKGNSDQMLAACNTMFHGLMPETGEFFDSLMEKKMFDLDSRDGKAPGGYCGSVDSMKSPFIFSNFNGTTMDIDVLVHESGHAFAAYEAYKNGIVMECRDPSAEACETHSTAMEMMTMPYHHLFFGEDVDRYDLFLMERTLTYLPGGCAGDEFQTIIYRNPDMTSEERHALWKSLREKYTPHFADYEDIPMYSEGWDWLVESQYFLCPMYLVDYGLARNLSLQLFLLQQTNPDLAWEKYLKFLTYGGTKTYIELARSIDLEIPFEGETIRHVIEPMLAWVKRQNAKVMEQLNS